MQEFMVIVSPSVILKHSCLSRCDLCSLVFKTSQGLQGHRISKQHLKKEMNLAAQPLALGAEALFGPPGKTEAWQPIDAGHLGAMIKEIAKEKFNQYLDHNDIMTGECRRETCN